jgi:hypothetical protein
MINYNAGDECTENLAGLGEVVYVGNKSDLETPLVATDDVYSMPKFREGKGLKKLDLRENSQKIASESQGKRKGYQQTATLVIDAVNRKTSMIARAFNNLGDLFLIFPDGDDNQIMYDPNKKLHADSGGITTDTGDTPDSERILTANLILGPVKYPNNFVEFKADAEKSINSWDDLVVADE